MQLHWHRRDLRADDNVGLAEAADTGSVVSVFVFDDEILDHAAPPRVSFLLDAIAALRRWYRGRGSDLVIAHGDPREVVSDLAAAYDVERVTWNRDYSGLARERDTAVRQALDDADLQQATFHDAVLHEPGSITTADGNPYQVFTYFEKKWRERPKDEPYDPPGADALADRELLANGAPTRGTLDELPSLADLDVDAPEANLPKAGPPAARERLATFCDGPIYEYDRQRDSPAADATSRLSADVKFGTVGIRRVYAVTEEALRAAHSDESVAGVEEFRSQLAWREFYAQVLDANPNVVTENYRTYKNEIEWREDPEGLQAWKDGETGYPIVDAGMRQLRAEGWIHNRVRMIVASFLTKDLLVDWREGYRCFREKLVDHDTAHDTGGWQWAASTGTDAQPYFRIFNPMTQGERYDPDAEYVTEYVPELRGAYPEQIHSWHELSPTERRRAAPEYPEPIVDHAERRELAIETFERARGDREG